MQWYDLQDVAPKGDGALQHQRKRVEEVLQATHLCGLCLGYLGVLSNLKEINGSTIHNIAVSFLRVD